jgi:hypothetical protein
VRAAMFVVTLAMAIAQTTSDLVYIKRSATWYGRGEAVRGEWVSSLPRRAGDREAGGWRAARCRVPENQCRGTRKNSTNTLVINDW